MRATFAAIAGWTFADVDHLGERLFDGGPYTLGFTLAGLALLGYGGYLTLRVLLDFAVTTTVSGEVLWHQLWQTRRVNDGARTKPVNYYLVIDDGQADQTRAWVLPAELADTCRLGDVVTARVRPWTRRVMEVTVQRPAPEITEPYDPEDETLDEGAVARGRSQPWTTPVSGEVGGRRVRRGALLTEEEVSRALGQRVTSRTPTSSEAAVQTVAFIDGRGRDVLSLSILAGRMGRISLAGMRVAGTPLPGIGEEAYARPNQAGGRHGEVTLFLVLDPKAANGVDPTALPALLATAMTRLAAMASTQSAERPR